tara:strand:- start:1578 stop:2066 length:489 start_codon:yes stop_codon:yes gene_type:complete
MLNLHQPEGTKSGGFTLMEVMVAITVITLVLGGGITALIQGNRMISDARDSTRISQIIQSEIETLRTMTFSDLSDLTNPSDPQFINFTLLQLQGQFAVAYADRYTLWRGVLQEDNNNDGTLDQIGVFIYVGWWPSHSDYWTYERYYTRFTEDGLNDYYYRAF